MPRRRIRAHYEQLSEFERDRIIELKEGDWAVGESLVIWVRAMRPLEDVVKIVVRLAVTVLVSSLLNIRRMTCTRVSTMTIHRRLIERNLRSYRPLRPRPFTPAHSSAKLQWCLN
ncbi:HTH_Tnp_Tc3_2 domain-containing protein [Trichonephila clavipes]|uniref:HTH_Tnp_Tc3_2 domain-containing protein n=1 Tax=Trichonephila clavipes TaxID=2585209 RepID=A0A8X6R495_TRICX|nr:HTH_Tnp_Tc3_2 domain-containing protein [Trichonephila clavipes]